MIKNAAEAIKKRIPGELVALAELFDERGFCLYAVGGLVRNALLGLPVSDIDICSAMRPNDVAALAQEKGFTVVKKGIEFGMVELHMGKESFEHTTFRADKYSEGGAHRPSSVEFSSSPYEDAFRRDFSVNALYCAVKSGEIIDPTGGMPDLEKGLIRTTSPDPAVVLADDGLRIMRLVRFCAELGFKIEARSFETAKSLVKNLSDISAERLRDELDKILLADVKYGKRNAERVYGALALLRDMGAIETILPELYLGRGIVQKAQYHRYDVLDHSLHSCAEAPPELTLRLAALLHDVGKPEVNLKTGLMRGHDVAGEPIARAILKRLKYDNRTADEVAFLVRHHMFDLNNTAKDSTLRRNFARWGEERSLALAEVRAADFVGSGIIEGLVASAERWKKLINRMREEKVPFNESELDCTGNDIMERFALPPCPAVGRIKKMLMQHCAVRPRDNRRERLLEIAGDYLAAALSEGDRADGGGSGNGEDGE